MINIIKINMRSTAIYTFNLRSGVIRKKSALKIKRVVLIIH